MNDLGFLVSPRVNQLDASLLDAELVEQLKSKLLDAFKFWNPEIKDRFEPELMLILKSLLFKVTIWDHATTYGSKLQNLVLVKTSTNRPIGPKTKALYGCITILGPYIWEKLKENQVIPVGAEDKVSLLWHGATLFNFVAFVFTGKYLTLVLRLLGIRYSPVTKASIRNANYEFQNRQLIWNALTEFLLFVLPLVNYHKILRKLRKLQNPPSSSSNSKAAPLSFLPQSACAICFEKDPALMSKGMTNPYLAGCEHPYCYVCLSLRLAEDPEWQCLKCNKQLAAKDLSPYYT